MSDESAERRSTEPPRITSGEDRVVRQAQRYMIALGVGSFLSTLAIGLVKKWNPSHSWLESVAVALIGALLGLLILRVDAAEAIRLASVRRTLICAGVLAVGLAVVGAALDRNIGYILAALAALVVWIAAAWSVARHL